MSYTLMAYPQTVTLPQENPAFQIPMLRLLKGVQPPESAIWHADG